MNKRTLIFTLILVTALAHGEIIAQILPGVTATVLPVNPTSADNLKLIMLRRCDGLGFNAANLYVVGMTRNNITVTLANTLSGITPSACAPTPTPRDEVDLGRLPAGSYTLTVIEPTTQSNPSRTVINNLPFTVADARATKVAPYVRLDYSGHWWDPNDSGWGLFIWHDARDNVLAAWFTYTPDGKPMWYVFQPTWTTSASTVTTPLLQTSRLPGPTSPPPAPTSYATVGSASLDFTNFGTADEGKITYTFTGGAQQVRNIQRFKP